MIGKLVGKFIMAIDFSKYKTYDTKQGFGNKESWQKAAKEKTVFTSFDEAFENINDDTDEKVKFFDDGIRKLRARVNKQGLKSCKTKKELKSMFRQLMKENHPDKVGEKGTEKTKLIIAEYEKLNKKLKK